MNPFTAFAIVQWLIVLPIQVYFVRRSIRNWKESERELEESRRYHQRGLDIYLEALKAMRSVDPDWQDGEAPPNYH